ncbi:SDR family oxidoreductase [Litorivicinus sp.]|nr:SDR family oxidoreductase [Litorivicinus sp.]
MNKIVVLTGSNGQLGKSLTTILLREGYQVIGIDQHHDDDEMENYFKFFVDITKEEEVTQFFQKMECKEDVVGLVNNAGIAVFSPFEDRTYAEIKSVMDVNIAGTILMTKNFMNTLQEYPVVKRVVNLGSIYGGVAPDLSIYGDTPRMSSEIYGMTKAAVINFTQYLASYYRGVNATFNCVSPGGIESSQGDFFKRNYANKVPLGRMADVSEIADVISFLLSDKASYINGENIFVDGGFTKW